MSRFTFRRFPPLARAYLLVAAADAVGVVLAVSGGLDGLGRALGSGTPINAPIPFLVGQLAVAALAVTREGRRLGTVAAALLAVLGTVSVLSGLGDGSFTTALTAPERAVQLAIVAATGLTVVLAVKQVVAARRPQAAYRVSA